MSYLARQNMKMNKYPNILCIGSVLWDVIGRAPQTMRKGSDVAGNITRLPGGVAMNIATTLAKFEMIPAILTSVGYDPDGDELLAACVAQGLIIDTVYRSENLPTDRYMAIEGSNGVIAAIADSHSLEAAGDKILTPLTDGTIATISKPYSGLIAIDGNLTTSLLSEITTSFLFARADLRVAPASPGKAKRLLPFIAHSRGTLYVNMEEASLLCQKRFQNTNEAAQGLINQGAFRVLVTNGAKTSTEGSEKGFISQTPPSVNVTRVTGAGDTFMAAHIAAEARGFDRSDSLAFALEAAAIFVSGGTP